MKKFIDNISVQVRAGNGGPGGSSFFQDFRQKHPRPDGGNGGNGGSVILKVDKNLNTLSHFRPNQIFSAPNGDAGQRRQRNGVTGTDQIFYVPSGTIVYLKKPRQLIADLINDGDFVVVATGGQGGIGNAYQSRSVLASKRRGSPGTLGVIRFLFLELKVIAKIGIIGLPNAGKSTLLAALTAAKPKVGAYEFTTITPNLGVYQTSDKSSLTIADLPGIIKGAAQNKGLGNQFLQHAERCLMLIIVVDATKTKDEMIIAIETIYNELLTYNKFFSEIPKFVVFNKIDIIPKNRLIPQFNFKLMSEIKLLAWISAKTKEGVPELMKILKQTIKNNLGKMNAVVTRMMKNDPATIPIYTAPPEKEVRLRLLRPNTWELSGELISSLWKKYDANSIQGLALINKFLMTPEIRDLLLGQGIRHGDVFFIFDHQFTWVTKQK